MFIAIVGTPSSGKRTILEYLVQKHKFQEIKLDSPRAQMDAARVGTEQLEPPSIESLTLSAGSAPLETPALETPSTSLDSTTTTFGDVPTMLDHVTKNWKSYLVTTDLKTFADVQPFVKRPFFMLLSVDGPLRTRFVREQRRAEATASAPLTLERFVDEHDLLLNGPTRSVASTSSSTSGERYLETDYKRVQSLATLSICNDLPDIPSLHSHLDGLDLLDEERLRPGWDTYFMTLASLASHRSNCMKRRVGALLVRSKRILSTGYNGTAKGTRNCNEGGCSRCNGSARGGESLNECLCLHAEENALLEAGKDRIGEDSVIYCNTCPCLRCSVKIVQCGVREVVYNQSYSMDEASARVLKEAGVILRQLHLPADMKAALL